MSKRGSSKVITKERSKETGHYLAGHNELKENTKEMGP